NQQPDGHGHGRENRRLRRQAQPPFLSEKKKPRGKIGERIHAAGNRLGQSAKERVSAQRDDERRQAQPGDERGVESARQRPDGQRAGGGGGHRPAGIAPEFAEQNSAQAEQRPDREVYAAREDDRRHHQGQ